MPVFNYRFTVDAPVEAVAAFHFQPGAFKRLSFPLTPAQLHYEEPLADGSEMRFTLWFGPLPVRWRAVHSNVGPHGFTDTQVDGLMRTWVHTHRFIPLADGRSAVEEEITMAHHGGWRGLLTRLLFAPPALKMLFSYRRWVTRRLAPRFATNGDRPVSTS